MGAPEDLAMALTSVSLYALWRDTVGLLIVALAFPAAFVVAESGWIMLGQRLCRVLTNKTCLRVFNRAMAALLVATLYPVLTSP